MSYMWSKIGVIRLVRGVLSCYSFCGIGLSLLAKFECQLNQAERPYDPTPFQLRRLPEHLRRLPEHALGLLYLGRQVCKPRSLSLNFVDLSFGPEPVL